MRRSVNKEFGRELIPMPQPLYLYLSRSEFLTNLNKQLCNGRLMFKFLNHGFNFKEIYKFINFGGIGKLSLLNSVH